jgi:hypothetical protein
VYKIVKRLIVYDSAGNDIKQNISPLDIARQSEPLITCKLVLLQLWWKVSWNPAGAFCVRV